jgi:hypothetical protein
LTPRVFTTGGVIIDNVVSHDGALVRGQIGGNAIYSAAGARLWLDPVGLCARIPGNYPSPMLGALSAHGLGPLALTVDPVAVELEEWFFYRSDGERRDHLHATAATADAHGMVGDQVTPAVAEAFEAALTDQTPQGSDFAGYRRAHPVEPVHVPDDFWAAEGIHLAPNRPDAMLALAREARARGLVITCDPGPHAAAMDAAYLKQLLPLVDAFLPSRRELAMLAPGRPHEAALLALAGKVRGAVGVKLAGEGSLVATRGSDRCEAIGAFSVPVIDPTGAGDAYCGGFLSGLVLGEPPQLAARRATVSASFAVETRGPLPLLAITRAQTDERLRIFCASNQTRN